VLSSALATASSWHKSGGGNFGVCVNFCPAELTSPAFADSVHRALERADFEAKRLQIDLPAGFVAKLQDLGCIKDLGALGVSLALDDFSGSPAEVARLDDSRFVCAKLSGELVRGLGAAARAEEKAAKLIAKVREHGLDVIAKGVETTAQWDFLLHHKCTGAQGYLFGRPVPANESTSFLPHLSLGAS
jgi:EAL domain-containing protein (putative c-di-GMP-specific phosphodiesterase class I)